MAVGGQVVQRQPYPVLDRTSTVAAGQPVSKVQGQAALFADPVHPLALPVAFAVPIRHCHHRVLFVYAILYPDINIQ